MCVVFLKFTPVTLPSNQTNQTFTVVANWYQEEEVRKHQPVFWLRRKLLIYALYTV